MVAYYSDGEFDNHLEATAKQGTTIPQTIPYVNQCQHAVQAHFYWLETLYQRCF